MKILCILYDDPKKGMPKSYPLSSLPKLDKYPDGMTLPTPKGIDFNPGELLGCVSGELGLRKFLESNRQTLVVSSYNDTATSKIYTMHSFAQLCNLFFFQNVAKFLQNSAKLETFLKN